LLRCCVVGVGVIIVFLVARLSYSVVAAVVVVVELPNVCCLKANGEK